MSTCLTSVRPTRLCYEWPRTDGERNRFQDGLRSTLTIHQVSAKPRLDDLERWLRASLEKLSRKSDTAAAIRCSLNLCPALTRYCEDGRVGIDNSAAVRALRGVATYYRDYLLVGADSGGECAAASYSLIDTAKLNGIDPEASLCHVLAHIADHPVTRVAEFLPWRCAGKLPAV